MLNCCIQIVEFQHYGVCFIILYTFSRIYENWQFRVDFAFLKLLSLYGMIKYFSSCIYFRGYLRNVNNAKKLQRENVFIHISPSPSLFRTWAHGLSLS